MTYYMIEVDLGFDFHCLPHQNKKENIWSMFVSLDNVYSKSFLEGKIRLIQNGGKPV